MTTVPHPTLWSPDLAVGSVALDRRNRNVFEQLAAAGNRIERLDAPDLTRWLRTVYTQFETLLLEEEAELAEIAYPELPFHCKLHEQARSIIRTARLQLARSDSTELVPALTRDSCTALSFWLMRHVIDVDKLFFPYIDTRYRVA
ncbi:hemerythrin domain-containing protein [Actimicrobium antarcticum]|uniref:Hemerythrin-like domain-containing protein n=1 Tax=Actimicrobium antarcticum TaxID=1051899 RepID=A0ABP7TR85_9BURK